MARSGPVVIRRVGDESVATSASTTAAAEFIPPDPPTPKPERGDPARTGRCPKCPALPGERCYGGRDGTVKTLAWTHPERLAANGFGPNATTTTPPKRRRRPAQKRR